MPSTDKNLAFTISNLIASDNQGLLDILDRNLDGDNVDTSSLYRRVSLGWMMKFWDEKSNQKTRLPLVITQLIMLIDARGDHLNIDFIEIDVADLFPAYPNPLPEPSNAIPAPVLGNYSQIGTTEYTQEKINSTNYLSQVRREPNEHWLEHHNTPTKAVFFSRTQLLLFRSMLRVSYFNQLANELLFSGFKIDTGYMTSIRNMAEQIHLHEVEDINAKQWFTLKAELWPSGESGESTSEIVRISTELAAERTAAVAAVQATPVTPLSNSIRLTRTVGEGAENGARQSIGATSTENGERQSIGAASIENEGEASQGAKPEGQVISPCSDIKQAMHPLLSFAQPCPPGWGAKGRGGEAVLPYLSNIPGHPSETIITQTLCTLNLAIDDIARGEMINNRSICIPKNPGNSHKSHEEK